MEIKALVSQMTLEEKAGLCSGLDFWHTKSVERLGVPSVMVSDGPHGLRKQDDKGDHLGINDSIKAVCMPAASATAASFDRDLIRKMGRSKKIKMESIPYQVYKDEQYKSKLGDRAYEIMDQKRKKAVKETIGKVITYKGALIEPYFHAVSVGMTLDASEWFGKKIPYLRQKESLSDIESKDYMSIKTISYQRMQIILEEHMKKKITIQQLQKNLRILTVTKNGYVKQIKAVSYIISGEDFARWLQLASNNFYFEQYKGNLRIICLGKGNGLGLSQYGADQMAKQGKTYQKILKYYYPKTMIQKLYE